MDNAESDVSNVSKILKSKQFTTSASTAYPKIRCFQCFKDTKMQAIHNLEEEIERLKGMFPVF